MLKIGAHLSVAGGYPKTAERAAAIGANTFQFFIRNPRGVKAKILTRKETEEFQAALKKHAFGKITAHAPYTLNGCSRDPHIREIAGQILNEDIERMERFPGNFYNLHPGSHMGQGKDAAVIQIADMLNQAMFANMQTMVLLETMPGKGTQIGGRFEELKAIIERSHYPEKLGVCMDACHMWDAGYNIAEELEEILERFDRLIGIERLKVFHINNSMYPLGSQKDRHARLGEGYIGLEGILRIINHPALADVSFILETPANLEEHKKEIALLKRAYYK